MKEMAGMTVAGDKNGFKDLNLSRNSFPDVCYVAACVASQQ